MVVELLLLGAMYLVSAMVYSSLYLHEPGLVVSTLCISFISSVVNMLTFTACALYRKSEDIRSHYYQSITQATFCTVLISSAMYFVAWAMAALEQTEWRRAFFIHSVASTLVHSVAEVAGLALHLVLVFVAALGSYASTPEGSLNLLWFNTSCIVSFCVVWVGVFEVAEFGALHCYATTDVQRLVVFVSVNITFSLFFMLHILDSMNVTSLFGLFHLPAPLTHVVPTFQMVHDQIGLEYRRIFMGRHENNLTATAVQTLENQLEDAIEQNQNAIVRRPVLYFWRCISLIIATGIACIPVLRIAVSPRHSALTDDQILLLMLACFIPTVVFSITVLLCFNYMQLLAVAMMEKTPDDTAIVVSNKKDTANVDKNDAKSPQPSAPPIPKTEGAFGGLGRSRNRFNIKMDKKQR